MPKDHEIVLEILIGQTLIDSQVQYPNPPKSQPHSHLVLTLLRFVAVVVVDEADLDGRRVDGRNHGRRRDHRHAARATGAADGLAVAARDRHGRGRREGAHASNLGGNTYMTSAVRGGGGGCVNTRLYIQYRVTHQVVPNLLMTS